MKNSQLVLGLVFIIGLSIVFLPEVSAQTVDDTFGFNEDNVEDKAARIDYLIAIALIIGTYIGIKKLRK